MVATFAAKVRPVGSKTTLHKALRSVPVTTWHAIALMPYVHPHRKYEVRETRNGAFACSGKGIGHYVLIL
jgi:hypothetical protein